MRHTAFSVTATALVALAGLAACVHSPSGASSGTGEPRSTPAPIPTTFEAARRQCDAGDQQGCVVLAGFYWRGDGVARDATQAKGLIESACAAGNALACDLRTRYSSPTETTPVPAP